MSYPALVEFDGNGNGNGNDDNTYDDSTSSNLVVTLLM